MIVSLVLQGISSAYFINSSFNLIINGKEDLGTKFCIFKKALTFSLFCSVSLYKTISRRVKGFTCRYREPRSP